MDCLTIRQPWAYAIFCLGKDIENRPWPIPPKVWQRIQGQRVAIHAALGMTRREYAEAGSFIQGITDAPLPPMAELPRGVVLGTVEIVGCVETSDSPWFMGRYGFLLAAPVLLSSGPVRDTGRLGFWQWKRLTPLYPC